MPVALEYLQIGADPHHLQRLVVTGTTGSGKTTTAARIAARLGYPHVELDALHWEPGWQEAPPDVFRARVSAALSGDRWVVDGNYSTVRDLIWPRADTIVWLDYPFLTVLRQLVGRTARRVITRETLWGTNVERAGALFTRDSILLWMLRTYWRRRREFPALFARPEHAHLTVIRLRTPAVADAWIAGLPGPDQPDTH